MRNWFAKHQHRQYASIAVAIALGFILIHHFPQKDERSIFVGVLAAMIILNFVIYLVFRVDLMGWGYGRKKKAPEPKPVAKLSANAQTLYVMLQASTADGTWRTAQGLAAETHFDLATVYGLLDHELGDSWLVVRMKSDAIDYYTTRENYEKNLTWKRKMLSALTHQIR